VPSGDAGVKADEPAPPPPSDTPSSDVPPEKQDPFAPPVLDAGAGGGSEADGGASMGAPVDAGTRPIEMPPEKQPPVDSCDKPTCDSVPACGGVPGATRSSCHDTETGFEETCCFASTQGTGAPNSDVRDAGVDIASGGTGGSSGGTGTATAPDASVDGDPNAPKPEAGGSGGDTGTGGAGSGAGSGAGADSPDASVPPPQPPKG
jgi:hypothetical protein